MPTSRISSSSVSSGGSNCFLFLPESGLVLIVVVVVAVGFAAAGRDVVAVVVVAAGVGLGSLLGILLLSLLVLIANLHFSNF